MPREGTETCRHNLPLFRLLMHPMPREGTETEIYRDCGVPLTMHPMPREGTETFRMLFNQMICRNASYAP